MKKGFFRFIQIFIYLSANFASFIAFAQQAPDAGELLRQTEPQNPQSINEIPQLPDQLQPPEKVEGTSLPVKQFDFKGYTVVPLEKLQQIVSPWLNKTLTLEELKHVTDLIAESYREQGYLSRVYLPQQNISDGSVLVVIVEARLGKIMIDGETPQLNNNPDLIKGMMAHRQTQGELFNLSDIERAALLINDLPGINAKAVLAASEKEEHTDVKLSVEEGQQFNSYVSYDNYGSRSTGESRLIYSASLANPLQRGDKVDGLAMLSEGNLYAKIGYDLPVGFDGYRLGSSLSLLSYELGGEFSDLDAKGSAINFKITSSYPIIRQVQHNLTLSGNINLRDYENKQLGVETSNKSVTALNIALNGEHVDRFKGGGVFYYGIGVTYGDLDLSGNKTNLTLDKLTAETNGNYSVIDWNVARLQYLNQNMNLWLSLRGQFADKNLDSSETISLGGIYGVRAYPTLEASGDEGMILTAEIRYKLTEKWSLKGFYDYGQITQKATRAEASQNYNLKGIGIGADWVNPEQMLTARVTLANRIGENPLRDPVTGNDSDGSSNDYPIWLNITKQF
jgi:hemolysin activation/secretion protein